MAVEVMEKLEVAITVLLVVLVTLALYVAITWTRWRLRNKRSQESQPPFKYLQETNTAEWRLLSPQYIPSDEDTSPEIAIQPVQPDPGLPKYLAEAEHSASEAEEDHYHFDLGRLYFALQYDQHRSVLLVRLIRGEDIPSEQEATGPYVGVQLLPLNTDTQVFVACDTTVNVQFQETYEFPLTQSQLSLQTINFSICRYDRFSRKTNVGDVFLALAELGAQGIDITKEVYLCRNIINAEQLCQIVRRKRNSHRSDEENQESNNNNKEQKMFRSLYTANPKEMWARLRRAVLSGEYRGKYRPVRSSPESPLLWEPMFANAAEAGTIGEYQLPSLAAAQDMFYFSGPGPPRRRHTLAAAGEAWDDLQEARERISSFVFPEARSGSLLSSESNNSKEELGRERLQSSSSSHASPLRLSPAPEEYYKLVPVTPITPLSPTKKRRSRTDPPISWRVPESSTSRDRDIVQTLATSYRKPRVVAAARLGLPMPPSSCQIGYRPSTTDASVPSKVTLHSMQQKPKSSKYLQRKRKRLNLRRTVSSPLPRKSADASTVRNIDKLTVRLEPEGRAAPEVPKAKVKHLKTKKVLYKSKMKTAAKSYKSHSSLEDLETVALMPKIVLSPSDQEEKKQNQSGELLKSATKQDVIEASSELPNISSESVSTEEFYTPFSSPKAKCSTTQRESFEKVQSEPTLTPEKDQEETLHRSLSLTTDVFKTKKDKDIS